MLMDLASLRFFHSTAEAASTSHPSAKPAKAARSLSGTTTAGVKAMGHFRRSSLSTFGGSSSSSSSSSSPSTTTASPKSASPSLPPPHLVAIYVLCALPAGDFDLFLFLVS